MSVNSLLQIDDIPHYWDFSVKGENGVPILKKTLPRLQDQALMCIFMAIQKSITLVFRICWHKLPYLPSPSRKFVSASVISLSAADIISERSPCVKSDTNQILIVGGFWGFLPFSQELPSLLKILSFLYLNRVSTLAKVIKGGGVEFS